MKLSDIEFRAMNTWWRRWGHAHFELSLFQHLGLDVRDKDVLEIGCGNGFGAYLLNQLQPKSYIGLDVMVEQLEIARLVAFRRFDFDDISAKIAKNHRTIRASEYAAEI